MDVARRDFTRKPTRPVLLSLGMVVLLAACKSGGGGGTIGSAFNYASPFAPPAPVLSSVLTAASNFISSAQVPGFDSAAQTLLSSDPRYTRQITNGWSIQLDDGSFATGLNSYPLQSSGAAFAHAAGLTGAGQTVALADTHLNTTHEVFSGKPSGSVTVDSNTPLVADQGENNHGTTVASIIAGQSSSFIGVAPGANLLFGAYSNDQTLTSITNAAASANAVALNNSWGYDTAFVSASSFQAAFSGASGLGYLTALKNYAANGVVVFAVSNNTTHTHSTIMDALPYVDPSLEAGWIAVANGVPTQSGQSVTSVQMLSAGCMESARWCLVADGGWQGATSQSNISYGFGTGSSFAAPQVSGALALLAEAFPGLSPHDLRVRLLASADNHFFTPDGSVELATGFNKNYSFTYGVGFLDIRAALLPIGPTSMSLANGSVQLTNQPILMSGAALGDAVAQSLEGVNVGVQDALKADFIQSGAALAGAVAPASLSRTLLSRSLADDLTSTRTASVTAISDPFSAFSGLPVAVTDLSGQLGASVLLPGGTGGSYGFSVKKALTDGPTRLELGVKVAHDQGSVMGFGATGGGAGADMLALQLGLSQSLGSTGFLSLSGEVGIANLGTQAALTHVSTAGFNSVALDIGSREVFAAGDRLAFGVSMPVAVTSGHAQIVLPVARSALSKSFEAIELNLAPSDREVDMRISYQRPLSPGVEMLVELVHAENFGNRAGAQDTAGVLTVKYAF